MKNGLLILLTFLLLSSCVMQAPKYSPVENVMKLHPGQTQQEVSEILDIPPYDIKRADSTGYTLIYKYRVTDRSVIPLFMRPTNGVKAKGKWVDLFVTYSKDGKVVEIRSCSECGETRIKETKINVNALLTFLTITLPAILILLKL